jgi:hypothetical protein
MDNAARTRQRMLAIDTRLSPRAVPLSSYMLPFAAAMILLAVRLWQAAALPASQPRPEPAAVPV